MPHFEDDHSLPEDIREKINALVKSRVPRFESPEADFIDL
jgi:hypothetical protein